MSEEVKAVPEVSRSVILLIENDENDVFIFRRALATAGYTGKVRAVGSATEAQSYLEHEGLFRDAEYYGMPDMIVSDYRLAGQTAIGFVRWVKHDSRYKHIPILIVSGAIRPLEGEQLRDFGAVGFLAKTGDVTGFSKALRPFLPKAT